MRLPVKMFTKSDSIIRMVILFFVACLSFNTYFYVGHGNLNAYNETSQPAVRTGNEYLIRMGDVDYHFLEHLFQQVPVNLKISESIGKADTLLSYVAALGSLYFHAVIILVILLFVLLLSVNLPDVVTLINQKVRLDD